MMSQPSPPAPLLIPAFNEEGAIADVLAEARAVIEGADLAVELLVVDDGSTDATASRAAGAGARVIELPRNMGYGAALKEGIRRAASDRIVIADADGTYPLDRLPELIEALDDAEMAVGARVGTSVAAPLIRRPGKWIVRRLAEYITGFEVPDFNSGLRAFHRSLALRYLHLLPDGFSFTTTITVASLCDGLRVRWLPIDYRARVGRSKLGAADFPGFIMLLLRLSIFFRPLRVFIPVSVASVGLGAAKLTLDVWMALAQSTGWQDAFLGREVVSSTAVIFLTTGVQVFLVGLVAEALARRPVSWGR